jgi:hypothetical protein
MDHGLRHLFAFLFEHPFAREVFLTVAIGAAYACATLTFEWGTIAPPFRGPAIGK